MTSESLTCDSTQLIRFDGQQEFQTLAKQLLAKARRQICFFGSTLDSVLFDNTESLDIISEFARRSDKTSLKIVIHSSQQNVAHGHRLIALAQRLSSSIKIHNTAKQHQDLKQLFLIIDDSSYLFSPYSDRYQGRANYHDLAEVRLLQQTFDSIWELSSPDITLRRLSL